MEEKAVDDRLVANLAELHELEEFLFALLPAAVKAKPKPGDDLLPLAKEHKLAIPASLDGVDVTWDARLRVADDDLRGGPSISIVRPGNPEAVGLTIGCIRIGRRVKVCLECGWLYCKIVIKGRF
ncbi:MAG: hypothetical protein ABWY55_07715 [Microbacterium sp.]